MTRPNPVGLGEWRECPWCEGKGHDLPDVSHCSACDGEGGKWYEMPTRFGDPDCQHCGVSELVEERENGSWLCDDCDNEARHEHLV